MPETQEMPCLMEADFGDPGIEMIWAPVLEPAYGNDSHVPTELRLAEHELEDRRAEIHLDNAEFELRSPGQRFDH